MKTVLIFGLVITSLVLLPAAAKERGVFPCGQGTAAEVVWSNTVLHAASPASSRKLFDAIRQVESAGNDRAVGDGGKSRGPYQCGRAAWADGCKQLGVTWSYDKYVWDHSYCERVMEGYWKRYGCVSDEQKARCWNGGPGGMKKRATVKYYLRVRQAMN